jgi:hypothetical protein
MDYAYKINGQFIWPVAMRSRFNNIGGWHTLSDAERAEHEWYPINYINQSYSSALQKQSFISAELVNSVFLVTYVVRDLVTSELIDIKKESVRQELIESLEPPVEALGFTWNSGMNSSLAIDGAARIAQAAGKATVTIHSLDNKPHVLSILDATQVAIALGSDYQQKLSIKQAKMVALDEINLTALDVIEQIVAI